MTYRLRDGTVEVETAIENHGADPMPVRWVTTLFPPARRPRDQWHVHFAARDHMLLNPQLIPTGARKPIEFEDPHSLSMSVFDDVFGIWSATPTPCAFWVEGGRERVTVAFGPKYGRRWCMRLEGRSSSVLSR